MYHHDLIKILIEFHLEILGDNWDSFLVINHFKEEDKEPLRSSKEKRGRKRISENPIKKLPQQQLQEQSKDETPIAKILGSLKRQSVRRKKSGKNEESASKKTKEAKTERKELKLKTLFHQM